MHPSPKVIINACLTGMVPTREMTPYVPISPAEIAQVALECAALGASIVHLHPRKEDGQPTWEKEYFADIIKGIRKHNSELIISVTTSGRNWSEFERRSACLELSGKLKPDLASLTVGSLNFINTASVNPPQMIRQLAEKMVVNRIKPELEIFEPGMIHMATFLMSKGILPSTKPYFNLFFGSLGTMPLTASSLACYQSFLPADAIWSVGGIGQFQTDALAMGLALGGHVRVGLEDAIYFDRKREKLATNQELVDRAVTLVTLLEKEVATPREARALLGLED